MTKIVNVTLHILLIFAILITSIGLYSCDRKYDEAEVKESLTELLSKIGVLNTVYYGNGIDHYSSNESEGIYHEANFLHLNQLGFTTVAELKMLTKQVFTEKFSSIRPSPYLTIMSASMGAPADASFVKYIACHSLPSHALTSAAFPSWNLTAS